MNKHNLVLIAGGKVLEGIKQAQYFLDVARWAYSLQKSTNKMYIFCPKDDVWIMGIKKILDELIHQELIDGNFYQFTIELYQNAKNAENKEMILKKFLKATKIYTIIVLSNHGSKFGFSLPKTKNLISKEDLIKNNSGAPTLLIYDACGGKIFKEMPENWTIVTHPRATFSYITEDLEKEKGIEDAPRIGGLLTTFFLSQVGSSSFENLIFEMNKLQKNKVNWEKYGTEDKKEISEYRIYGSNLNNIFETYLEIASPIQLPNGILYATFGNTIITEKKMSQYLLEQKLLTWNTTLNDVKELSPQERLSKNELDYIF